MTDEQITAVPETEVLDEGGVVVETPVETPVEPVGEKRAPRGRDRGPRGGGRRRDAGGERRSEFAQKMISIRRVARVMAGGRRFNFSVCMVIGDKKGRVGVGLGKGMDTALAIDKATRAAKKGMISIPLTKNKSIRERIGAKFCASEVEMRPAPGRGLVAGSSVRTVLEHAGITDVTGKILSRSHNPINNARAAMEALKKLSPATPK